jgi:hypothetical protein
MYEYASINYKVHACILHASGGSVGVLPPALFVFLPFALARTMAVQREGPQHLWDRCPFDPLAGVREHLEGERAAIKRLGSGALFPI